MRGKASFIKPMLLLRADTLPTDAEHWEYQLKLDGYRAFAFKTAGEVHLRSRNDNDFGSRYAGVLRGLAGLPPETVIDGEVVALDETGRPSFNLLQNYASGSASIVFFVFDVPMLRGRDLTGEPLVARRELLEQKILPSLRDPIRYAAPLDAPLSALIHAVKTQGFEGLVAKAGQPLRIVGPHWRMDEDARQSGPGVRDWRLYGWIEELRRAHLWLLR